MRTHRITGRSQLFVGGGWKSLDEDEKESTPATDTVRMLDPFEQALVDGRGGVDGVGYFNASVYNGTISTLNRIVYAVTTRRGADSTRRTFSENDFIGARQTKDVVFKVDVADRNRSFVAWNIASVQATCPKKR